MSKKLPVLEFYSGIGGMHYSLNDACIDSDFKPEVVASFDINIQANKVYFHNFNKRPVNKLIESIPVSKDSTYRADMWLASPPCQPYTSQGLNKDSVDERSKSFLFLINSIPKLEKPPKYILIEHVEGFEVSVTRNLMMEGLKDMYNCQEFLLSPLQFQIPNSRTRYFCLAKLKSLTFKKDIPKNKILNYIPGNEFTKHWEDNQNNTTVDIVDDDELKNAKVKPIKDFLEKNIDENKYKLKEKLLSRYGLLYDIVKPSQKRTHCFTKGYYHDIEEAGSILQCDEEIDTKQTLEKYKEYRKKRHEILENKEINENEKEEKLKNIKNPLDKLNLRYFSSREIARLMCFPESFTFPNTLSLKQQYKLLGNSLNCKVVSALIKYLLSEKDDKKKNKEKDELENDPKKRKLN
ncbi:S-adenosyl-L-methionine-dependent methyltransferase [Neocallimastix californiae]|uniref:S-adenosyl-L-methionine-dependent methyltransferase n=1 Tax=Neocallimastix californiae TaxID=1754190 RepID=A0A1Y2ED45_9FUNG|nr:S-adenosyl-L-methionine-dependent methyltransferase [Neocallimastix californiae]|eukprot:ORY69234.1 S-adenosyl-L-methionine-dependent methyltransferase [Neocallimastix californiae]